MTEDARIVVTDAPERKRFEVSVDTKLGGGLARFALDRARAEGAAVLPFCPFVNAWIERHPEYVDLVPPAYRASFDL